MKTRPLVAGAAALSLLLGGCSAIKVSSSEDAASKPAQVGISDEKSTASPSPTGATIPEGMSETTVELGAECPVEVSLALGPDWADGSGYEGYRLFTTVSEALITVNCYEDDEGSAKKLVDKSRERMFSTSGSAKLSEASGSLDGGEYWVVHGKLAAEDMRAVDEEDSTIFGVVAGISVDGRLFKVAVDMLAQADDTQAQEQFRQMLPTVRLDGHELETPDLR